MQIVVIRFPKVVSEGQDISFEQVLWFVKFLFLRTDSPLLHLFILQ